MNSKTLTSDCNLMNLQKRENGLISRNLPTPNFPDLQYLYSTCRHCSCLMGKEEIWTRPSRRFPGLLSVMRRHLSRGKVQKGQKISHCPPLYQRRERSTWLRWDSHSNKITVSLKDVNHRHEIFTLPHC